MEAKLHVVCHAYYFKEFFELFLFSLFVSQHYVCAEPDSTARIVRNRAGPSL